ncbi:MULTISPECIES: HigA family addiction module antitoxin [Sphaerospermopsis]|uniref:Putative plasmid maintenance system antidote protein, XRE family n=1 Tax=Sphaerospermopsis reniformis TaxID=531300 RepID=A0A480A5U2_9CYAN|nr:MULTISPECIES: HigA family addiction module antitoxin [Sphaerospermopsis]MBD2132049.1 HigA family addiction module antidote protein [Sphaerospermopsis sp. FACHB-1094]MBD2145482.1 HigA family addiction module antidote protein [Sphaerospermopsis sp. FACHB-1194]GCL39882.1 putative plasmid maintenance system antidote protein, XRE family [Sphaerospermopsis reniformis]
MTVTELANILGVSRKTVSEIVNERASVTPNIALRLASAFQTTPELRKRFDVYIIIIIIVGFPCVNPT